MPIRKESLAPEDLLLRLNDKAKNFDTSKYEDFIYELCDEWDFQKDAIRNVLRFYMSGIYTDSQQLLEENYENNQNMKDFEPKSFFIRNLPFPSKLACTIDLATGTGKTWVMYGVARILLAEGLVDHVLVLCPSKTVKYEVFKKFSKFNSNSILTDALPKNAVIKVPGIKQADETIEKGDICIDNVHKTYDHVSSSISDSLKGKGNRVLVINDEAHHLLNPTDSGETSAMLEWRQFLDDSKYNFRYILNLSGTPYKDNSYFNDVIYRFSIRDAINQKFVKDINYLEKDETDNWKQRWKTILSNHEGLKKRYPKAKKHITIVVTNSIQNTSTLTDEIKDFLKKNTKFTPEEIENKVLPVTSSAKHEKNREILKTVDSPENPVEWIVSVSMLTEGWDVQNIFQIVPHENRAFNSKLLIAQVLGRGLRVSNEYKNDPPKVLVYNHTAWSTKIDHLVMEVAEISRVLRSSVVSNSPYNFELHKLDIEKTIKTKKEVPQKAKAKLPESLGFSSTETVKEQSFRSIREKRSSYTRTNVADQIKFFTVDEAVNSIFTPLYLFDMERGTDITSRVTQDYVRELVKKELRKIGEDKVSDDNLQSAKSSFGALFRQFVGTSRIEDLYGKVEILKTTSMQASYLSESSFKQYGGLVSTKTNMKQMPDDELRILDKIKNDLNEGKQTSLFDDYYVKAQIIDDLEDKQYRSPLDITLLSHVPEREFVENLVRKYSKYIDMWVKSKDKGFYSVPYIHRPGTHSLQKDFNPDFFIKKGNKIIVVEIKCDDDSTVKNKDKLEGALIYFKKLNEKLGGTSIYEFHFLQPSDYTNFFDKVIVHDKLFKGSLHSELESKSREQLKEGR